MNKEKQFEIFLKKLKNGEPVSYRFVINLDWFENHGRFENNNNDWIMGVTERFIDGDDGRSWINFKWIFKKEENKFYCFRDTNLDKSVIEFSGNELDLKYVFKQDKEVTYIINNEL